MEKSRPITDLLAELERKVKENEVKDSVEKITFITAIDVINKLTD